MICTTQGRGTNHRHTVLNTETTGMKRRNKDTGTATARARVTIIEGGTATDWNTIIMETGNLTMHTGGMIGRMITSISADKIRLCRVAEIGTVMISDVRDHILLTMNRDDDRRY